MSQQSEAPTFRPEEMLISVIADLLDGVRHVAVGNASPIPGSASLLARARSNGALRVSILGSRKHQVWSDTGVEMFDCAAQGRMDAFFLGGGQIDSEGNINLVGVGEYPRQKVRWAGSFGSAFLYFVVPRIILFREEHTRRVFVPRVDFISAPGTSAPDVPRVGGPYALVTSLCHFAFDKAGRRFRLKSIHAGHTLEEVRDNTGFEFDIPERVAETPAPNARALKLIRGEVAAAIADAYPLFAKRVWGGDAGARTPPSSGRPETLSAGTPAPARPARQT
jgi:glutaconate CoA-transferase, subunit B